MRRHCTFRQAGMILVIGSVVACSTRQPQLTPAHEAAIGDSVRSAMATYQRLAAAARWDSLANLYTHNADLRWIEDGKRSDGSAIRKALGGLGSLRVETSYDSTEVAALAPGVASVTTYYRTEFVGTPVHFSGAISMIWVHEPDGWRIRSGHSSVAVPHDRS